MLNKSQQFRVIIEQDEDGFFVASVPALPGCYTQAKTMPELKFVLNILTADLHYCQSMAARILAEGF